MTGTPAPRVDISDLGVAAELGTGGQGKVRAVNGLLINGQWPAAVKIYSPAVAGALNRAVLEKIVALPQQVSPGDSNWLHQNTAWPSVITEQRGTVCGFLMRRVPDPYYFGFQTQTLGVRQQLADMAFLLNPDPYISSSGLSVSDRDRLGLLASVAQALSRLHGLGVTVGDLSPKNLLFSLSPPSCFIIDCDAVRIHGQSVLAQVETPDWEIPAREEKATPASDAFKFGLLAIRLFARDQSSYDRAPLTSMSSELGYLAEKSLRTDPSKRPSIPEWLPALEAASATASATPTPLITRTYAPTAPAMPVTAPTPRPPGPPPPRRKRHRIAPILGAFAALTAVAVGAAAYEIHTNAASHNSPGGASVASGASSVVQQADQINDLLNSSAASRHSLTSAVQEVDDCSNLSSAISAISAVAQQRSSEYSRASTLPTAALPNGAAIKSDLLSALGYSVAADKDFLTWAQEQSSSGCSGAAAVTPAYNAGVAASAHAVTAKNNFLDVWNPVASTQRLPTRSQQGI